MVHLERLCNARGAALPSCCATPQTESDFQWNLTSWMQVHSANGIRRYGVFLGLCVRYVNCIKIVIYAGKFAAASGSGSVCDAMQVYRLFSELKFEEC